MNNYKQQAAKVIFLINERNVLSEITRSSVRHHHFRGF